MKLAQDPATQSLMNSLWQKALTNPQGMRAQLKSAFLGRAKPLIHAIRMKRRSEALGVPTQKTNGKVNVPANAGVPRSKSSTLTKDEVRKKRMSEMDIIMHGAK